MKATVKYLWETGREIITFDNSEIDRPADFGQLKKCDNVIVGERVDEDPRCKTREVLIDDKIFFVIPVRIQHPITGDEIRVLEIM
mgnify:FL=1